MTAQTIAKRSVIGGVAFMVIHAVLAAVWRRVLLADTYETNGFFDFNEPSGPIVIGGLASYFLAGLFFSMLYGHFTAATGEKLSARIFAIFAMLFWVVGDFGYISRHDMDSPALFLGLEAAMVAAIFAGFAVVLPLVFGVRSPVTTVATT